ncbi:MAG: ASKHA domain-containing protein [Propionibacteriaceae bacterium]|jgi:uncharacterized 2Fe-2S/4Fe-4S cluster protein (DUF4445 family)|nr:ASKHA domain-containing protein [Propionibacteriaceae bacterium]
MDKVSPTDSGILADALAANGHNLPMPCRGRHTCGKCGVYLAGAAEPPGDVEQSLLARNPAPQLPGYSWRLACLARIRSEVSIVASSVAGVVVADVGMELVEYDGDAPASLGCAVDVGTTTVTLLLFRLGDRERVADVSELNQQVVHGADVLSRIDAAAQVGVAALQSLILAQLRRMLSRALDSAGACAADVSRVVITGNTTMLHLLTGRPVASLGVFPFTPDTRFGHAMPACAVFPQLSAELYLPPAISAYVGPDIVCGILATGLGTHGRPEVLIDVGTNGEMVLVAHGRTLCCSTAAGPAFEGAEISAGMPALPGAIDGVWVDNGQVAYSTIGKRRARGICGTGLIGAVDTCLALGVLDETGALDADFRVGDSGISITQADIRKLQLAKAAIAAGVDTLLSEAGLAPSAVAKLELAGGFGSYLQAEPAAAIGLFPRVLASAVDPAGNTALAGAVLLTLSRRARDAAARIAAEAEEIPLAANAVFLDRYVENMAFPEAGGP